MSEENKNGYRIVGFDCGDGMRIAMVQVHDDYPLTIGNYLPGPSASDQEMVTVYDVQDINGKHLATAINQDWADRMAKSLHNQVKFNDRVTELLNANNALVERARAAEHRVDGLEKELAQLAKGVKQ